MSDELEDQESKTEEPSQKRIEESIEKGQVVNSREVTSFIMLLSLSLITIFMLPYISNKIALNLKILLEQSGNIELNRPDITKLLYNLFNQVLFAIIPIFLFLICMIIFSSLIQHGQFIFAPDQIMPKYERISLSKGIERLFSLKSFMEFLKGIVKLSFTSIIIYIIVIDDIKIMPLYPSMSYSEIVLELFKIIKDIIIAITLIMAAIAIMDFSYQKYEHHKNMMMSRHELKEEYKQTEGSPEIKKKQKQLRSAQAKKRMMSNVPKADVIITNPEHYSIALEYKHGQMRAPILVAKGLDLVAMRIREIAKEHDIPIVENPPLARALYLVELEHEIPMEHYEAVAKIISFVYKLKKKKFE